MAYIVVMFAFVAIGYVAWYQLPGPLIHWAAAAWWHWPLALLSAVVLLLAPFVPIFDRHSLTTKRAGVGYSWLWILSGYVGRASSLALVLSAFTSRPAWWIGSYWWLWGAAVIVTAVAGAAGAVFATIQPVAQPMARGSHSAEWCFNHGDTGSPPTLGLAMSGGGIRSAAFNIGVLQALHESGILPLVDVMSAVSGGSYAMSWYLLQPYYAAGAVPEGRSFDVRALIDEMFDPDGRFQAHLCRDPRVVESIDLSLGAVFDGIIFQPLRALNATGNLTQYNVGGIVRRDYRYAIQRLFHGPKVTGRTKKSDKGMTQRERRQQLESGQFCAVEPVRYTELSRFARDHRLPFFIFNGAVLVDRASRNKLWPTAFEITAHDIGSDVCGYRQWADLKGLEISDEGDGYEWPFIANLAPAISGAAVGLAYVDPKGLLRQRLKTWTPFIGNLDLGYLFPLEIWDRAGAVYVSDGGHSENLGAYALLKRQCRTMIVVDAEEEATRPYRFGSYCKLKTCVLAELQLDVQIREIDAYLQATQNITPTKAGHESIGPQPPPLSIGAARSRADASMPQMSIVYIKLALNRERLESYPGAVREYAQRNATFPQDPTSHQVFSPEQFVAYRELGRHVAAGVQSALAAV